MLRTRQSTGEFTVGHGVSPALCGVLAGSVLETGRKKDTGLEKTHIEVHWKVSLHLSSDFI